MQCTLGGCTVRMSADLRLILILTLIATGFTACSRDPNVRKQKYFHSGQRYFDKGKYPEAAIEFVNAIQIDPGYAEAHNNWLRLISNCRRRKAPIRNLREPSNYNRRITRLVSSWRIS